MENINTDTLSVICDYLNEDFISFAPVSILFRNQWGDKKKYTRVFTRHGLNQLIIITIINSSVFYLNSPIIKFK